MNAGQSAGLGVGFDAQVLDLLVERVAIDAKVVGGLDLDAIALGEGALEQGTLHLVDDDLVDLAFTDIEIGDGLVGEAAGEGLDRFG